MSSEESSTMAAPAPSPLENHLEIANERKAEGNDCFRAGKWNEAVVAYRSALNCLPTAKRRAKANPGGGAGESSTSGSGSPPTRTDGGGDDEEGETEHSPEKSDGIATEGEKESIIDLSSPAVSEADKEVASLRAVLNANIGACFVKLGDHKEAVKSCSEAILDDPTYIKARERRAASNDILNTWTSLTAVQEDYNALLNLPTSPAQQSDIRRKLQLLKPRLEAAQKRETDEMLSKLKGLGNSLLGNFGLSTDNFKFEPNGAGGYSVNFSR